MHLGITVFKRQREESVRDTEENKMFRKGGREAAKSDTWKTQGRENFRMEKSAGSLPAELRKMMIENRPKGLSSSR